MNSSLDVYYVYVLYYACVVNVRRDDSNEKSV